MSARPVTLTEEEIRVAISIGVGRHFEALRRHARDSYGYAGNDPWTVSIEGACGELVVAKFLGRYWGWEPYGGKGAADIAGEVEVRTRSRHSYDLPIRDDDDPTRPFVLVTGRAPCYVVRGWIRAADARREEWWHAYAGREAHWYVPASALADISTLEVGGWPP